MSETFASGSLFAGKVMKAVSYDPPVVGTEGRPSIYVERLSEIDVGTTSSGTADYPAVYDWDNNAQRMSQRHAIRTRLLIPARRDGS